MLQVRGSFSLAKRDQGRPPVPRCRSTVVAAKTHVVGTCRLPNAANARQSAGYPTLVSAERLFGGSSTHLKSKRSTRCTRRTANADHGSLDTQVNPETQAARKRAPLYTVIGRGAVDIPYTFTQRPEMQGRHEHTQTKNGDAYATGGGFLSAPARARMRLLLAKDESEAAKSPSMHPTTLYATNQLALRAHKRTHWHH